MDLLQGLQRGSLYSLRMESCLTDNHLEISLIWSLGRPLTWFCLYGNQYQSVRYPGCGKIAKKTPFHLSGEGCKLKEKKRLWTDQNTDRHCNFRSIKIIFLWCHYIWAPKSYLSLRIFYQRKGIPCDIQIRQIYFSKRINIWEWKVRTFLVTHLSLMIEDDYKGKLLHTYRPLLKMTLLANFFCAVLHFAFEEKIFFFRQTPFNYYTDYNFKTRKCMSRWVASFWYIA